MTSNEHDGGHLKAVVVAAFDHFELTPKRQSDAWWFHARILDGHRAEVAQVVAKHIARRLLEPSPTALANWMARHGGGSAHDEPTKAELEAYLLNDFADASNSTRLIAAVVEHLWSWMAMDLDGGWGKPLHVEHDHFSVIDHGGDGLSIYDSVSCDLRFRLWESKQHVSAGKSVTKVVTGASRQLERNAAEYLARMSKPLQLNDDPRIQQLSGKIVKLWTTEDETSGVGVSVGTTNGRALPSRPFKGLAKTFSNLGSSSHREGLIIEIPNLAKFATEVRAEILRGIE